MDYIKVCGLKRIEDIENSIKYGANALGFVYKVPDSPRNLEKSTIERFLRSIPRKVIRVLVLKPRNIDELKLIVKEINADLYQIHGDFKLSDLEKIPLSLKGKLVLGFRVNQENLNEVMNIINKIRHQFFAFLIDNSEGDGHKLDVEIAEKVIKNTNNAKIILAGGIDIENAEDIVKNLKPYGIDVSSSLESEKGVKDPKKIKQFLEKIKKIREEIKD